MSGIKLYDYELSVNCYKQRLLLSMLGLDYERVPVDFFPGKEHRGDTFRRINPLGHIPVLDDGGFVLWDASAISIYLATRYDDAGHWYPVADPERLGRVASWMAFAEGTTATASAARLHDTLGYEFDVDACRRGAQELFRHLDRHLWLGEREGRSWLVEGENPTIADLAVFPDAMLAPQGGIPLTPYPAIRRWTDRVKAVPGFVSMAGIYPR